MRKLNLDGISVKIITPPNNTYFDKEKFNGS